MLNWGECKMEIKNQVVMHKSLGEGTICQYKEKGGESYIIVDFSGNYKEFLFPDIFKNIIKAKDENFKEYIIEKIAEKDNKNAKKEYEKKLQREKETKNLIRDNPVLSRNNSKKSKVTKKATKARGRNRLNTNE